MLIIKIQDGENIERALKRLKRKYRDTKVLQKVRENQQFTKKSVERRKEIGKAAYIQNLRDEADQ